MMPPGEPSITVRMYNPGFGDCLLIGLPGEDGRPRYVLIDCGVHHQYPDRQRRSELVAEDIVRLTGNHLDAVAITHQHTDHLYGFKYARGRFEQVRIDQLWLPWTEDPDDAVAGELKGAIKKGVTQLKAAITALAPIEPSMAPALQGLLDFEPLAVSGTSSELDFLRGRCPNAPRRPEDYLWPGQAPLTVPGVSGVNVYALGPPRKVSAIKKLTKESEMYPELASLGAMGPFLSALGVESEAGQDEQPRFRVSDPFVEDDKIPVGAAAAHPEYGRFFRDFYGFDSERGEPWRRIDADWLAPASELALAINSLTNNTSLVLAFELTSTEPRRVLLFAADAQVGNWLSWQDVEFPVETARGKKLTGADLLKRTVLYKVGHHGSRNATLRQHGLELMDDTDLVALIPVDEAWAKDKMDWEHPARNLLDGLMVKAKNRVLRTDRIGSLPAGLVKPAAFPQAEWDAFLGHLKWDTSGDHLWVEYTVSM